MSPSPGALEVGALIADTYEVTRLLGRGGMGEVWLASHRRLPGKQVAIKVLYTRGQPLSADALTRFRREAEVATRIGHPNIVEVHDFNTLPSGSPYLVLEYLQGETLASRLRHGAMDPAEASAIVRQVGSALDASHQLNVVHRDLKPDNIFLVPSSMGTQVKVLDFGISKIVDSTTLQTQEAVLVGTPQYMSPEQAVGHNKDVGPQTDIFALGSIAYEMLAGQPAFSAENVAQVVFRIAYEPHRPLSEVRPGLPPHMVAAVEKALLKDRAQRYDSVAQFVADFSGQPVTRAVPRAQTEESSGIARPGADTPESLMMANTSARTPAPLVTPAVMPLVTPAAMPPPMPAAMKPASLLAPAAPPSRRPLVLGVVAVAALAAVVGAVLLRPAPPPVRPRLEVTTLPEGPQPGPPPPSAPATSATSETGGGATSATSETSGGATSETGGGANAAQVGAGPGDPGPPPAPRADQRPTPPTRSTGPALTAEEQQKLLEVRLLLSKDPRAALHDIQLARRKGPSDAMEQRLLPLAAMAACSDHDQANTLSLFQQLHSSADRSEVRSFCRQLMPTLELR